MNIHEAFPLEDCPFCGGPGLLEEEGGWCWYVTCVDCGSQTAAIGFQKEEDRSDAARRASELWNMRKVIRSNPNE